MNAKIMVETGDLSRAEWLEYRRKGIGGSDVAAILGLSRWKSPVGVWMDKTGQIPISDEQNDAMRWGTILEGTVREHFQNVTGRKVVELKAILQHPKYDFMLADLDGITLDDNGNPAIFEAKTASAFKLSEWEDGKLPIYYHTQIAHYFEVTGLSKAYVACLVGGNDFKVVEVDADKKMQKLLVEAERAFWDLVVHNQRPPIDASDECTRLLNYTFKGGMKEEILLPSSVQEYVEAYLKASEEESKAKEKKQLAANRIKEVMKDNDKAACAGHSISWVPVSSERFDAKAFQREHPEEYRRYVKKSSYRRFTVK